MSNVTYGAPLGKVYSGVLALFLEMDGPLDETMEQAGRQDIPAGTLLVQRRTTDTRASGSRMARSEFVAMLCKS